MWPYQEGQLVWARIASDPKGEPRACVVVGVPSDDTIEVVYGQGEPYQRCPCPVYFLKGSLLGKRLVLTKTTHFSAYQLIRRSEVTKRCAENGQPLMCPESSYAKIEAVAAWGRLAVTGGRVVPVFVIRPSSQTAPTSTPPPNLTAPPSVADEPDKD